MGGNGHLAVDEVVDALVGRRAAAAQQMAELGGASSACAMGRDGRSFPAYKYHEGQAAGFGSAVRVLRRAAAGEAFGQLDVLEASSRTDLERRSGTGRDWEAYSQGVLDAVLIARELLGDGLPATDI